MMLKITGNQAMAITLFVFAIIVYSRVSTYQQSKSGGAPVGAAAAGKAVKSIFDLPCSEECLPGPSASASYYTNRASCGVCGAQQFVRNEATQ
jgi:hypothetical protein